jgi:hypothetical protein
MGLVESIKVRMNAASNRNTLEKNKRLPILFLSFEKTDRTRTKKRKIRETKPKTTTKHTSKPPKIKK